MRFSMTSVLNIVLLIILSLGLLSMMLQNSGEELVPIHDNTMNNQRSYASGNDNQQSQVYVTYRRPLHSKWDPFGLFGSEQEKPDVKENIVFNSDSNIMIRPVQRNCSPVINFGFVKTHKAGSTTLISILQRFGYTHNLQFALPKRGDVFIGWPYHLMPEKHVLPLEDGTLQFNLLVNHAVFNKTRFKQILPHNPKFFGIVRYPLTHFKSAMNYFKKMLIPKDEVGKYTMMERIIRFAEDPEKHDGINDKQKNSPDPAFHVRSVTNNFQSADFGLDHKDMKNPEKVEKFIKQIKRDFPLLLVMEHMQESLLLLKRKWCWDLRDILFIKKNIFKYDGKEEKIPEEVTKKLLTEWLDIDLEIYKYANSTLWREIGKERGFDLELSYYKSINNLVGSFCMTNIRLQRTFGQRALKMTKSTTLDIAASPWNEAMRFDLTDCEDLVRFEMAFTRKLQIRQRPDLFDGKYYLEINDGIRKAIKKPPTKPITKPPPTESMEESTEWTSTEAKSKNG